MNGKQWVTHTSFSYDKLPACLRVAEVLVLIYRLSADHLIAFSCIQYYFDLSPIYGDNVSLIGGWLVGWLAGWPYIVSGSYYLAVSN